MLPSRMTVGWRVGGDNGEREGRLGVPCTTGKFAFEGERDKTPVRSLNDERRDAPAAVAGSRENEARLEATGCEAAISSGATE